MKFLKIFSFLLSFMLLSCSSSSSDVNGEITISCSPTSIDVPAKGGTYKIMVVASAWRLGSESILPWRRFC